MFTETADTVGTGNTGMIGTDRLPAITQPPGWPITLGTGRGGGAESVRGGEGKMTI